MPLLGPMLIRGMDTTDTEDTEVIMAMPDLMVTMERGLLRLCLLLRPRLPPRLRLIPGMDTMDTGHMAMDTTDTGLMAMDTTMARGPQMLSLLLRPMPLLGPMLIRGMDTTDTEDTEVIMAIPDLMDTTVTMERGLLRLCLLLRPRLPPRLRLIPGMDTMDTDTGLMATDTMDTGLMVMDAGERSKKPEYCQLILNIVLFLPTLKHLNTSVYKTFSFENFKNILFCLIGCRDLFQQSNK